MSTILDSCQAIPVVGFEPGDVLLDEGGRSGRLYVLEAGAVEIVRSDTQVAVVGEPGSMFGEMSILLDVPHTATVRAITNVQARVADDAEAFLRAHPEIGFHIARLLAKRLNAATTYLVDVKQQYSGHGDHLGMVGDVLDALIHEQDRDFTPGEDDREADSRL